MELTLYTQQTAQYYDVPFDFTTEELEEVQELARRTLELINQEFDELSKLDVINQMIAAKFAYNYDDQPFKNQLIFTIDSPNKYQPEETIECMVLFKEHQNNNIEVINIAAYFA